MELVLHGSAAANNLSDHYRNGFGNAIELFVVSAYLTEWDSALKLNPACLRFRVIIGSDFGITRKAACRKLMQWLPPERKGQFMVADLIAGFHPKAVFWRDKNGKCYTLIGSSNLTRAAFETNYEANAFCELSETEFIKAKKWIREIEKQSVIVSEDWLKHYKEDEWKGTQGPKRPTNGLKGSAQLIKLKLPNPEGTAKRLEGRRNDLDIYKKHRAALEGLFRRCAENEIGSGEFYSELPKYWSYEVGDRLQGKGWEIKGKRSNFHLLSRSFIRILDASDEDRDDVVREQIDELGRKEIPTRNSLKNPTNT